MGYAHPDELLSSLSSKQLSEWMAWARIRGMPERRADFRSGQICAVLGNIHRDRDSEAFTASTFVVPEPWEREEEAAHAPTPEQLSRALMDMLGKKD